MSRGIVAFGEDGVGGREAGQGRSGLKWPRGKGYKERCKSANRTAVAGSSFGASFGFHATMNRTDADFTL